MRLEFSLLLLLQLLVTIGYAASDTLKVSVGTFETELKDSTSKLSQEVPVTLADTLKLSLSPKDSAKTVYAVVAFTHSKSKQTHSFAFDESEGKFTFFLNLESQQAQESGLTPGKYQAVLYLAGAKPITWELGTFDFKILAFEENPALKDDIFYPLPELEHTFRPDITPSPKILSYLFTGLCLSPILFLLSAWKKLGANVNKFPFGDVSKLIHAVLFVAPLSGFIYILYLFWVKLNLMQALTYLVPLAGILVLTTRNAVMDMA